MSLTTDRNDEQLQVIQSDGQQASYLILSDEEVAKGFTRPLRISYKHIDCGHVTSMGMKIAETYARDRSFYTGTYCAHCQTHFKLCNPDGTPNFLWEPDGSAVGS